tara:strand:+ start:79 stop:498 length:420 start_codon:yes stop_codon:yes gene_type:complete
MVTANETAAQPENAEIIALNYLMSIVEDKRTLIQFEISEKCSRTYRIKASSFREAKELINNTHSDGGCYYDGTENYDEECYYEVDGSHAFIREFAPTFDDKIKQVKIYGRWFDLSDIVYDPLEFLRSPVSAISQLGGVE